MEHWKNRLIGGAFVSQKDSQKDKKIMNQKEERKFNRITKIVVYIMILAIIAGIALPVFMQLLSK